MLANKLSFGWLTAPKAASSFRSQGFARSFATERKTKDKFDIQKDGKIKVTFDTNPFAVHKCEMPAQQVQTSKDELMQWFKSMTVMRRMEVVADNLYKSRQIRGFLHLYNGQEAVVAGYESVLTKKDHVITAYRDHATYLGRGGNVEEVMAELMGKVTGCSRGKGGSMHMYKKDANFHGGNGIVGAQVPVGTGVAFAQKYLNTGNVVLSLYGDGASNQGQIFEAFNMASLWKLPVIFGCENNKYGMGTSAERSSANTQYYTRGDYIPGIKIEAMNVLAVKAGMQYAANHARTTGPMVVEFETYRYSGHSMSDPGLTYRTKEEVTGVRTTRDPIEKVKWYLLENNLATEQQLEAIEAEVKKEVDEATKNAKDAAYPDESELYQHVQTDKPYFVRGVELSESRVVE